MEKNQQTKPNTYLKYSKHMTLVIKLSNSTGSSLFHHLVKEGLWREARCKQVICTIFVATNHESYQWLLLFISRQSSQTQEY